VGGHWAASPGLSTRLVPFIFFVSTVGYERSAGRFFWVSQRERERGVAKEGKKNLLPLPLRV